MDAGMDPMEICGLEAEPVAEPGTPNPWGTGISANLFAIIQETV